MRRCFAYGCMLFVIAAITAPHSVAADKLPDRYILEYPAAEQFCPPVVGFFEEVERTMDRVGGRTFRHQLNGGYGLPVQDKVGNAHLLHLGADVGFYRVGEPVFAVASGVVRLSQGPPKNESKKKGKLRNVLAWGNVIVLEHKLPDGTFATTIYGHLASDRLVKAGDTIQAGQQIGTIGPTNVNGGYKPHLHFGVRQGRMAEKGRKLLVMSIAGKALQPEITEIRKDAIVLSGAGELPEQVQMGLDGRKFEIRKSGDKAEVEPALLWYVPSPEFMIVGYGLSTDGWMDPIAFLKARGADLNPAPFGPAKRGRNVSSK